MSTNSNLHVAKKAKKDEFYTQLNDIEKELKHYRKHFKDKVVLCNCDDPYESNFFKYFALNFNSLGLKKLITTCYKGSPIVSTEMIFTKDSAFAYDEKKSKKVVKPFKLEINEIKDFNKDNRIDLTDVEWLIMNDKNVKTNLEDNGDFRSFECINIMKQVDIVVTNPPFSLFREYIAQLIEYKKQFLIVGNQNEITYKNFFPLIATGKVWLGYNTGDMAFKVPDYYEERATRFWIDKNNQKWRSFGNMCWYTNMDIAKRHKPIDLFKKYNSKEYPKYDNYDVININKVNDIPENYRGAMGVPITFLDKYCPEQFKIVDARKMTEYEKQKQKNTYLIKDKDGSINGKPKYARICIKYTDEWIKKHPDEFKE